MLLRDLPPYTRARIVRLLVPEDLPPGLRSHLNLPWSVNAYRAETSYDPEPSPSQIFLGEGDCLVRTERWTILPELSDGNQTVPPGWEGSLRGGRIYWGDSSRSYDSLDWTEVEIVEEQST
jgi:hypothetical protein